MKTSARNLFAREVEIKEAIRQCWAEAKAGMDRGTLLPFEDHGLEDAIRAAQANAAEDDWREGRVQAYLEKQPVGTKVCVRELRKKALYPGEDMLRNDQKESMNLGIYMGKAIGWKALPNRTRPTNMPDLGPQKCWEKENAFVPVDDGNEVFP